PELQEKVNRAIERGSRWLKGRLEAYHAEHREPVPDYRPPMSAVSWRPYEDGAVALMGLALLESGVPADDPVIDRTAEYLRKRAPMLRKTYNLATAIFFLERLGTARDRSLIKSLALRLVAGQSGQGCWGYVCTPLSPQGEERLLRFLTETRKLDPESPAVTQ